MNSIERSVERAERAIGIEGEPVVIPTITYLFDYGDDDTVYIWSAVSMTRPLESFSKCLRVSSSSPISDCSDRGVRVSMGSISSTSRNFPITAISGQGLPTVYGYSGHSRWQQVAIAACSHPKLG